jgi:hypothetical protein
MLVWGGNRNSYNEVQYVGLLMFGATSLVDTTIQLARRYIRVAWRLHVASFVLSPEVYCLLISSGNLRLLHGSKESCAWVYKGNGLARQ